MKGQRENYNKGIVWMLWENGVNESCQCHKKSTAGNLGWLCQRFSGNKEKEACHLSLKGHSAIA